MNIVGSRIRKFREEKGVAQENMADLLEITQSNYGRLEKDDKRLSVPKVQKISEALNISISQIFNEQSSKVIHQNNNESPSAYNVENLYQDNKEVYDKLDVSLEQQIEQLKSQVNFLQKIIDKSNITEE
tara:strand:- start:25519 stop:25905 length:387 start_codon:yes stop_codon:yes gene_type:complete